MQRRTQVRGHAAGRARGVHELVDVQPEDVGDGADPIGGDQRPAEGKSDRTEPREEEVGVVPHVLAHRVVALRLREHDPEHGASPEAAESAADRVLEARDRGVPAPHRRGAVEGRRAGRGAGHRELDDEAGRFAPGRAGEVAAAQPVTVGAEQAAEGLAGPTGCSASAAAAAAKSPPVIARAIAGSARKSGAAARRS